jgi:hypothetical protein
LEQFLRLKDTTVSCNKSVRNYSAQNWNPGLKKKWWVSSAEKFVKWLLNLSIFWQESINYISHSLNSVRISVLVERF